jgi:hypothetical protein
MKALVCCSLVFATLACADEAADRSAIERVIGALNDRQAGSRKKRTLFTPDADSELEHLSKLDHRLLQLSGESWSEVTTPSFVIHSIRFVTTDVALVNAASTQYGSTILVRRIPLLLVMKKEGSDWRIASLRVVAHVMSWPSAGPPAQRYP